MLEAVTEPTDALRHLMAEGCFDREAVDRFLDDNSFPLQEDSLTTFVYRGEVESVRLRHWVEGRPNSLPFERIVGSDLWHVSVELPHDSRIEYKLEVLVNGTDELIQDPLNPLRAHDPFGINSVCYGPGYSIPDWTLLDPLAAPGSIKSLTLYSEAFAEKRQVGVYLPSTYRSDREHPILIAHDGRDFVRFSGLKLVLDNLIHRREIAPLVVALTQAGDRLAEYAGDPRHARHLAEELLPHLEDRYSLVREPAGRGLMGASFGAVASLYTAWRHPTLFGRLLLQSGSFVATRQGGRRRGPEFRPVVAFTQLFRSSPRKVSERVYVSCGLYESLIHHNRELVPLLEAAGMEVRYTEARDSHNWEHWRDRLREALTFLFPGPMGDAVP